MEVLLSQYSELGDSLNLMLAAAVFHFKKWVREVRLFFMAILLT